MTVVWFRPTDDRGVRSDEEMNEEATTTTGWLGQQAEAGKAGCQFCLSGAHSRKYRGNMEKMEERKKEWGRVRGKK